MERDRVRMESERSLLLIGHSGTVTEDLICFCLLTEKSNNYPSLSLSFSVWIHTYPDKLPLTQRFTGSPIACQKAV